MAARDPALAGKYRWRIVLSRSMFAGFGVVAAYLLVTEHRAHAAGYLLYALVAVLFGLLLASGWVHDSPDNEGAVTPPKDEP